MAYPFSHIKYRICRCAFLLGAFLLGVIPSNAAHIVGGDLGYRHLGGLTYEINLSLTTESDHPSNEDSLVYYRAPLFETEWLYLVDSFSLTEHPGYTLSYYRDTLTFEAPGDQRLIAWLENRVEEISNCFASEIRPLYVEARFRAFDGDAYCPNHSVRFDEPAVLFRYRADTLRYAPAVVDPNGDSLAFRLVATKESPTSQLAGYSLPDSLDFDTLTGAFRWVAPAASGIYVFSIEVTEFRQGEWMSTLIRDFCLFYDHERKKRKHLHWDGSWAVDPFGNPVDTLQPGDSLSLSVYCHDTVAGAWLFLEARGEPFLPELGATWTGWGDIDSIGGTLIWIVPPEAARPHPHLLSIRCTSGKPTAYPPYAGLDAGFVIQVDGPNLDTCGPPPEPVIEPPPSGLAPQTDLLIRLFPNPTSGGMYVDLPEGIGPVQVQVYDLQGRPRGSWSFEQGGIHSFRLPQLASGPYIWLIRSASEPHSLQGILARGTFTMYSDSP